MEALIYGVIDKAKIVNLLNDPPEKIFIMFNIPFSENTVVSIAGSTPGTGMYEPKRTTRSISKVKIIFFPYFLNFKSIFNSF